MAVAPWPRGRCPGHVPSMLSACALCRSLGTTRGLVLCMTEALCISGGVQGLPQRGRAGLWGRGSSPEAALLCPRDWPLSAVPSVITGPTQSLSIPCPFVPFRRIEELSQELAASNQLVEMLSAEKRDLQQRLEGSPVMEGQVSGQGWGDPREEDLLHSGLGWLLSSLSPSGAVAGAVPCSAWQGRVIARNWEEQGGSEDTV